MDWKKIRQAVRTVLAAVLICAASVGITGDPAYAADMGAVYGIYGAWNRLEWVSW